VAAILAGREVNGAEQISSFLSGGLSSLPHPGEMLGLERATARLLLAVERKEPVVVHGDYDVDGITATAMLVDFLGRLGLPVRGHIPHRNQDGYGLSVATLEKIAGERCRLVVTVDTGITSLAEAAWAAEHGIDLIITDHHQPRDIVPKALAVVNPLQEGCSFPDKQLAGVGIAIYLLSSLRLALTASGERDDLPLPRDYFDLAALGTICDIVSLRGVNRVFVREGLRRLPETTNVGLRTLLEMVGLAGTPIQPGHVGFVLGPRLNSAGRMDSAQACLDLFLTKDTGVATAICRRLENWNQERQRKEQEILEEAKRAIRTGGLDKDRVIVVAQKEWPIGIIGIVASRIADEYHRPCVVISIQGSDRDKAGAGFLGRGSARARGSGPSFPWHEVLAQASDLLETFGGHRYAAGLTVKEKNIPAFRERLLALADRMFSEQDLIPRHHYDVALPLKEFTPALWDALSALSPFGHGNPEPVFLTEGVDVISREWINGDGLRFVLQSGGEIREAAWFPSRRDRHNPYREIQKGDVVDILHSYHRRHYRGRVYHSLSLRDIRKAS
jgi:single-stranded-DNA-specific exonuclease